MAMTSVSARAQVLPVATPASTARPVRRALQVTAKHDTPQKAVARTGLAAAAAAALLVVRATYSEAIDALVVIRSITSAIGSLVCTLQTAGQ